VGGRWGVGVQGEFFGGRNAAFAREILDDVLVGDFAAAHGEGGALS